MGLGTSHNESFHPLRLFDTKRAYGSVGRKPNDVRAWNFERIHQLLDNRRAALEDAVAARTSELHAAQAELAKTQGKAGG